MEDGSVVNMSLPIVLPIDDRKKVEIGKQSRVALVDSDDRPVAFLTDIEIDKHHKEEWIARTWGTTAPGFPYAQEAIENAGDWLIGGNLEVIEPIKYNDGLDRYRLSPAELHEEFNRRDADAVFAFQLRNPVHNGHALLMTDTRRRLLEMVAAYDKKQKKMAFFDPSRPDDFLFISGTKMRTLAKNSEHPPDGFMCPGGWKVLVEYYNTLAPNKGDMLREAVHVKVHMLAGCVRTFMIWL